MKKGTIPVTRNFLYAYPVTFPAGSFFTPTESADDPLTHRPSGTRRVRRPVTGETNLQGGRKDAGRGADEFAEPAKEDTGERGRHPG